MNHGFDDRRDSHIAREKAEARKLRQSTWWKSKVAQESCHYCGCCFPATELTMDHIVPIARGGKSTRGNVVPCCKTCNTRKNTQTPVELLCDKGLT